MRLAQGLHKIIFCGENRGDGHHHDHHLAADKPTFDQHMAHQSTSGVLVVGFHFEILHQLSDGPDNAVRRLVLNHTTFHRDHPVRARLIDPGDNLLSSIQGKGSLYLVAIVVGMLHADNRVHPMEPSQ